MNLRSITVSIVVIFVLATMSQSVLAADRDDTPALREAAAQRYLKAVPVQKMIDDMLKVIMKSVPAEKQTGFDAFIRKTLRPEFIEQASIQAMVKTFTVHEINAMTSFYNSPEGRSVQAKMGTYLAEIMPLLQQEMLRALQEINVENEVQQKKSQDKSSVL
jgi:hypothetical protein